MFLGNSAASLADMPGAVALRSLFRRQFATPTSISAVQHADRSRALFFTLAFPSLAELIDDRQVSQLIVQGRTARLRCWCSFGWSDQNLGKWSRPRATFHGHARSPLPLALCRMLSRNKQLARPVALVDGNVVHGPGGGRR